MTYIFIPVFIILGLVLLFVIAAVLARFRGGRYLRPIVATLAKIGFMRRLFEKASTAQLERSNPELAAALRKMQRGGANADPQKAQQALSTLSATERRAYLDLVNEQGPEPANRQQRRLQQKFQQGSRPAAGGAKRPSKKRR